MSDTKSNDGAIRPNRWFKRGGPVALTQNAKDLAAQVFAAHGFDNPQLVLRWREFAGAALGRLTAPISLSPQGQLTISADPSVSLFLQHQTPQLIQRINLAMGSNAVSRIKVLAGKFAKPYAAPSRPVPTQGERAIIGVAVEKLPDGPLREALASLGGNVLASTRAKSPFRTS